MQLGKHSKIICIVLLIIILFSACGNEKNKIPGSSADINVEKEQIDATSLGTADDAVNNPAEIPSNPVSEHTTNQSDAPLTEQVVNGVLGMDGSTSATPLEAGLRAELLQIPYSEALSQVEHTTTHESFNRLLSGETDLIFTVPISAEQQAKADAQYSVLVMEPVAMEGFVFVVNIDNPVDSLTIEQLQGIYSGTIKNWAEVGGNDAPIVAYQRNEDSGSQNYMKAFMGDISLMRPETSSVPGGMSGMLDAITVYDNAINAIGYSVFSYAAQMYANKNEIKFISVNGIAPTKTSMADGSYPLLSCTYAMYLDQSQKNKSLQEFVNWITSPSGQTAVLKSGYIPVIDMEIPENYLPYEAVGTGMAKPSDYKASELYSIAYLTIDNGYRLTSETHDIPNGVELLYNNHSITTYEEIKGLELIGLKDTTFQDLINTRIVEMFDSLEKYKNENLSNDWYPNPNISRTDKIISLDVLNGYLSISIGYPVDVEACGIDFFTGHPNVQYLETCETACFDLINKKEIKKFSELFYKGTDIDNTLNNALSVTIPGFTGNNEYGNLISLNGIDFAGLLGNIEKFTLYQLFFPQESPYFQLPTLIDYDYYTMRDDSIAWQYRNMDSLFLDSVKYYEYETEQYEYATTSEGDNNYLSVIGSRFHSSEECAEKNSIYHQLQDIYRAIDPSEWYAYIYEYKNYYLLTSDPTVIDCPYIHFTKDSLAIITLDDVLKEGWEEVVQCDSTEGIQMLQSATYDPRLFSLWNCKNGQIELYLFEKRETNNNVYFDYYKFIIAEEYVILSDFM